MKSFACAREMQILHCAQDEKQKGLRIKTKGPQDNNKRV
jgi:hypothetical protein